MSITLIVGYTISNSTQSSSDSLSSSNAVCSRQYILIPSRFSKPYSTIVATEPHRVSLSMQGTFTDPFSNPCSNVLNPAQRLGDIRIYLTMLCSFPIAPNALHFTFIHSAFSASDTFAVASYVSNSFTLGPNNSPLTAICMS